MITFDDAYRGAVTAGVAALTARGLPATIFVAPHFVDGGTFWWDCVPPLVMTERFRERALNEMGGRDHEVRRWMNANGSIPTPVPDHQTCASMEELAQTAARPGITLASHSWSHPNLTRLPSGELEEELRKPLAWLRENFRNTIPWISYPYGISSEGVEEAARANGYRGALRAGGGWLPASLENRYALPRQNVSSALSIEGFGARSAGLLCR